MKTLPALCLVAALSPVATRADDAVDLHCQVYGMQAVSYEYKTILDESWRVDPSSISVEPARADGSCSPFMKRSRVFGDAKGTRLQFEAAKCGSGVPYYTATLLLNGLPLTQYVEAGFGKVVINEVGEGGNVVIEPGGELAKPAPLSLPEGNFAILFFGCDLAPAKGD